MRILIGTLALCLTISTQSLAAAPVVVEFFETPSCSPAGADHGHSHPIEEEHEHPPEKFAKTEPFITFQNLTINNPDIIALTCKIDNSRYNDTIIDPQRKKIDSFCSDRRYGYSKALKFRERKVYPNILINAKYETNGEMPKILQAAIKLAKTDKGVQPLELGLRDGNILDISLPKLRLDYPVDIWVFTHQKFGNTITDFKQLPPWDGRYYNLSLPLHDMKGDNIAIIIQDPTNAKIIAAGKVGRNVH